MSEGTSAREHFRRLRRDARPSLEDCEIVGPYPERNPLEKSTHESAAKLFHARRCWWLTLADRKLRAATNAAQLAYSDPTWVDTAHECQRAARRAMECARAWSPEGIHA